MRTPADVRLSYGVSDEFRARKKRFTANIYRVDCGRERYAAQQDQ